MGSKLDAVDYEDALPEYSPSPTIVALSCAHAYTIFLVSRCSSPLFVFLCGWIQHCIIAIWISTLSTG
jgi:hypothetical protein